MNQVYVDPHSAPVISTGKGVLALSRRFGVMTADPAIRELLGCTPTPGQIWPLERLFAERDVAAVHEMVEAVFEHGASYEKQRALVRRADGPPVFCRYDLQPLIIDQGCTIGIIFTFHALPAEATPKTSDTGHAPVAGGMPYDSQALFEHLPKGSFTVDAQWHIRAFNQAAEQITGFQRREALGRPCWEVFRSESCQTQCPMRQALDRKLPEMDRQVVSVKRNGQRQTLSVNASVLKNRRGEIIGAVETFHPAGGDRPMPFGAPGRLSGIIGHSPSMRALFARLPDLAASSANVLICGESGTGKELIARTLHQLGPQPAAPFVAVNCAALAENLIESELFGHEKGAFTGAESSRPGRFEAAGRGTLLLDEIGELKPDLQIKLLRVIEQRSFERVGGTRPIDFEARLISATHQDMIKAIQARRFREDLYYRLRTVTLTVPPLRRRPEDIPLLVDYFIKKFNTKTGKDVRSLDPKIMHRFMGYAWPGNVRELARCIEHAFVFVKGPVIFQRHLPEFESPDALQGAAGPLPPRQRDPDDRQTLVWALNRTGGRREAASKLLGISRTSMWRRMKALGLE